MVKISFGFHIFEEIVIIMLKSLQVLIFSLTCLQFLVFGCSLYFAKALGFSFFG